MKNKKFLGKRILSIALTILMVLSCVPLSTFTVSATSDGYLYLSQDTMRIQKGKTITLTTELNADGATVGEYIWKSSNENIAKVDSQGNVTAVSEGTATITVNGEAIDQFWYGWIFTASCEVSVYENNTCKPYDGKPVTPQKVTDDNYASLGFTNSNYKDYKGWFAIRDATELYGFANIVNSGQYSAKAVLMQDIVVNENVSESGAKYKWTPIGCFEKPKDTDNKTPSSEINKAIEETVNLAGKSTTDEELARVKELEALLQRSKDIQEQYMTGDCSLSSFIEETKSVLQYVEKLVKDMQTEQNAKYTATMVSALGAILEGTMGISLASINNITRIGLDGNNLIIVQDAITSTQPLVHTDQSDFFITLSEVCEELVKEKNAIAAQAIETESEILSQHHMMSYYAGSFDGNGHYISGLYCSNYNSAISGFIGNATTATVNNLTIKNSYFNGMIVGGVCGFSSASNFTNCCVESDVIISGINGVGGIIGWNDKSTVASCVGKADVFAENLSGAIAGVINGTMSSSITTSEILTNNFYINSAQSKKHGAQNGISMSVAKSSVENIGDDKAGECTALTSSSASHTCVAVQRKETTASCEYGGCSAYSYCLICNKTLSGSNTTTSAQGHNWKAANCKMPKVCITCGVTEGSIDLGNHISSETYFKYVDSSKHSEYHSCCNTLKQTVPHNAGDPATCLKRAYCYDCGHEFGTVNDSNHESDEVFCEYIDDSGHIVYYTCCKALKGEYSHNADKPATCVDVAHCNGCDNDFGKVDLNNHISNETYLAVIDGEYHGIYYKCCNTLKEKVAHTASGDSVATCTGVAHCDVCGTNYGSKDSNNHTGEIIPVNYDYSSGYHRLEWSCCHSYAGSEKHSYVYSVNTDTNEIIGNCPDCGASYSVGISVPENPVYTGFAIYASTTGEIKGISPVITYSTADGKAPVNVGTYTATITLGNATISDTFTITPKTLTLTNVVGGERYYDGTNNVPIKSVDVDGIVVLETKSYWNNFTTIYDDVYVDYSKANATVSDVVPGYYDTVEISGCTLAGESAGNYTLTIADEVTLERFCINYYYVNIDIENQNLLEGEALDNSKYMLRESLPEGYELTDVVLAMDEFSRYIYLESYAIKKDGVDCSDCFDVSYSNGVYAIKCLNHDTSNNGICPNCDTYEPAKISLNEWGEFVYEISNAGQLLWFGEQVNFYGASGHAKLMDDIDLNPGYTFKFDGTYLFKKQTTDVAPLSFTPIGNNNGISFNDNFDGNGKTISGIYINTPESEFVGLFGKTDYMRTISDLHISNSYICGDNHVGAIAGYSSTNYNNCSVDETVTVVARTYVGGMIGYTWGCEITNSFSRANVVSDYSGGITGVLDDATIKNSYTTHHNLASRMTGTIVNSYYFNEPANYNGGRTSEQFASGEVAYLLQNGVEPEDIYDENDEYQETITPEIWGQTIGEDNYPVLCDKKKVYYVTNCKGETAYSNTNVDAEGHSFNNTHVCKTCYALEENQIAGVAGYNISLGGNIAVNYYMVLDESVATNANTKVVFTVPSGDEVETVEYSVDDATKNGDFYVFTCEVSAKEMASNITCKVVSGNTVSSTFTYSVKQYADTILANPDKYEKELSLVKAMLNYGAYAQEYFNHNTDNLANASLDKADKAIADELDLSAYASKLSGTQEGVSFRGSVLSLKSETAIKLYFKFENENDVNTIPITVNGEAVTATKNGNYYEIKISNIPAHKLSDMFEVKIGDLALYYGAFSYGHTAMNTDKEALKNAIKAMYAYNQVAVEYKK